MAELPTVIITINRERRCAEFAVHDGIDDYTGVYHEEDARMHGGAILHERTFLDLIEASRDIHGTINAFAGVPCAGHATVRVVFSATMAGVECHDEIAIVCDIIEIDASERRERQNAREFARLEARCAQLEARLVEQSALAEYQAQYGQFPRAGYRFCLEMFRMMTRGELPIFPMLGCDFIRIGNTYYECDDNRAFAGFKRRCIVACSIPQSVAGDHPGTLHCINPDVASVSGDFDDTAVAGWLHRQYARAIRNRSIKFMDTIESAQSIIGDEVRNRDPRYLAMIKKQSCMCINQTRASPTGYKLLTDQSFENSSKYFGATVHPEYLTFYYNVGYGNSQRPITEAFDRACAETIDLEALAIESGMKPWHGHPGFSTWNLPGEGWQ